MKVFLTGGNGFFGQAITQKLLSSGAQVTILTRLKSPKSTHPQLKFAFGDITKRESLNLIHGSYDVLIHSAAHMPKNPADDTPEKAIDTNTSGTLNILRSVGRYSKKIIYVGSIDVYGGSTSSKDLLNEESPLKPKTYYGATKLAGEHLSQIYCQTHSLPLTILRFTVLYGPGDTINRAIPNFIKSALNGQPLMVNTPELLRDYLSTGEAARALYLAGVSPKTGTYLIGSGKSITIKSTAEIIIKSVNPQLKIKSTAASQSGFHIRLNCVKASSDFGFIAKPFPHDLNSTILWQKQHLHK